MNTTICAIATAQGGAIGIIRVSGPYAISIVNIIFRPAPTKSGKTRPTLLDAPGYTIHYGQIINDSVLDDVLVTVFRAPHSYTGEDSVEISCHGSSYILQSICQLLISHGCQQAAPGEYTQRAYLNGKLDLSQAEAVADLIASQNAAQHRVSISQLRGGISTKLHELRDRLLHLTSLLELELDFSDHEDLEFADRTELLSLSSQLSSEISHLIDSFQQGNAIKNGIPVAIIGAPNVGKSTLLNQLLQDDKAIVSNIAGTTRDTIEDTITINGVLYRFIDTAGIRETDDTIENLGIERSMKAADKALIIILMRDNQNDYPSITPRNDQTVIRINNKSDDFQALNGIGIDWLKEQLSHCSPHGVQEDAVIITNARHYSALCYAYDDITRAQQSMEIGISGDLIAEDLRQCLTHLADIVGGEITPDEVLGNIFKHFCIGK